ncbi:MAG TPA: hypothetical protein VFP28_04140 [Gemmatimonadales bacterium]|nr:hypothetical protein [Gemmatimonadales bacterium]
MTAIFRHPVRAASGLCVVLAACGGRAPSGAKGAEPTPARVIPLASAIVLETAGPPPSDTAVTFTAGESRVIVLRHGPPENVVFAEVWFAPQTFHADSGRPVKVEIRPRPGVYGIDLVTSVPFSEGASIVFKYPRYFSGPAKARAIYGSDGLYERALAIGQVLGTGQTLALLPTSRPAPDNLQAALPAPGTYLVAAPESP